MELERGTVPFRPGEDGTTDDAESDRSLPRLVAAARAGGVLFLPTDTIYGLSCRFGDLPARERIRQAKGPDRPATFVSLVADRAMAYRYAEPPDGEAAAYLEAHWPGPVTLILRAHPDCDPELLGPNGTLAFRWPARRRLCALIGAVGEPLISTSANRHGEAPCASVEEAVALFGAEIDLYADAGPLPGAASTLVDLSAGGIRVLRGPGGRG
ncbi:MAG: L-threonylcarbamoyladenylate synthase [Candidatus Eisenbacteria bacterium]|nr:L-threonylcarbamoyladenylate synthase [Candidatus Eisenbacteria bacterium]